MIKNERRCYDKFFKLMVVELQQKGKTLVEVGNDLGIGVDLVRRWSRELTLSKSGSFPGNGRQLLTEEQKR